MGKVVDILEKQPHLAGAACCLGCSHKWTVVAPQGTIMLECPSCGLHKGVFAALCITEDEEYWECKCGCCHFYIQETIFICCLCGNAKRLSEI